MIGLGCWLGPTAWGVSITSPSPSRGEPPPFDSDFPTRAIQAKSAFVTAVPEQMRDSRQLGRHLVGLYAGGSAVAIVVVLFLVLLGLEFTGWQWAVGLTAMLPTVAFYLIPDILLIRHHYRPIRRVLERLENGQTPPALEVSDAIVRALNLPYYTFLRVVLFHGPAATVAVAFTLLMSNAIANTGFQTWQVLTFSALNLCFASPAHAIFEFFSVSRCMVPVIERLFPLVGSLAPEYQAQLKTTGLKKKLLFLALFVTSIPLLFLAGSVNFKLGQLISRLGAAPGAGLLPALLVWIYGVVAVCMIGAIIMSVLTALEVSRSAAKLIAAMRSVERGDLDVRLQITSTDEYAEIFRGFNRMAEELREEVKILGISHSLMGEIQLNVLLERIIHVTTELLDADRSTLFLHDPKTGELWSRFAEGIDQREIRIPSTRGIAGAVFTSGKSENITDVSQDPRFNPEVDRRTGYRTQSMLAVPMVNKSGRRIGVTQALNKRGGPFNGKDEVRLRSFTAQIAIALENAKLFDDVLRIQNLNESILRSTSNAMITLDDERRILKVNAAAQLLLQLPSETTLSGQRAEAIFAPPNDWVLERLAKVEETGETNLTLDAELQLPAGGIASVNLSSVPLLDAAQRRIGSMLILDDISDEKRVKSTMSRYMSKEVVDQLLQSGETALGGQVQRISILFSDIRNFTNVSEAMGARETVSMLNEYFADMVDVVFRHGGILDKYIGDAVMALFGAPFPGPEDADHAVRVANDMIVTLRALNTARAAAGKPPIAIGVGVNTGDAVVGSIGSPKRMEYTAIGDTVNLASRLEAACKVYGVPVLLSEHTVGGLTPGSTTRMREIDLMRVKGKQQAVAIYEALDHHTPETFPNLEETLDHYTRGLTAYRQGDWQPAATHFAAALAANPGDAPSQLYRDRCTHFAAHPPPADWAGIWTLKEK